MIRTPFKSSEINQVYETEFFFYNYELLTNATTTPRIYAGAESMHLQMEAVLHINYMSFSSCLYALLLNYSGTIGEKKCVYTYVRNSTYKV